MFLANPNRRLFLYGIRLCPSVYMYLWTFPIFNFSSRAKSQVLPSLAQIIPRETVFKFVKLTGNTIFHEEKKGGGGG